MSKHKHYNMIVAKAANADLVIFSKSNTGINGDKWKKVPNQQTFPSCESQDYFLCLPQHKEVVLHSLNGGEIGCYDDGDWLDAYTLNGRDGRWKITAWYMNETEEIIIKPKKQQFWIGVRDDLKVSQRMFESEQEAKLRFGERYSVHPIEVEVQHD